MVGPEGVGEYGGSDPKHDEDQGWAEPMRVRNTQHTVTVGKLQGIRLPFHTPSRSSGSKAQIIRI